jgi:hypothetical protein
MENAGFAGIYTAIKNNIVWRPSPSEGTIVSAVPETPASNSWLSVSNNWRFNFTNTAGGPRGYYKYYGTKAYATTPGTGDRSGDPQFVQPTRNFTNWCTVYKQRPSLDACLLKFAWGSGTYDPSFVLSDAITWVRNGFAPQNPLVARAGDDNRYVGAIPPLDNLADAPPRTSNK